MLNEPGKIKEPTAPAIGMRDKDFLFSIILMVMSLGLIVYALSISVQAMKTLDINFYTSPGFSILVVAVCILLLSITLLINALKNQASLKWLGQTLKIATSKSARSSQLVFLYLFLYMVAFWEYVPGTRIHIPFWMTTFIFLIAMMTTFKATKLKTIVVISAITTLIVEIAFKHLAQIPLP